MTIRKVKTSCVALRLPQTQCARQRNSIDRHTLGNQFGCDLCDLNEAESPSTESKQMVAKKVSRIHVSGFHKVTHLSIKAQNSARKDH